MKNIYHLVVKEKVKDSTWTYSADFDKIPKMNDVVDKFKKASLYIVNAIENPLQNALIANNIENDIFKHQHTFEIEYKNVFYSFELLSLEIEGS